MKVVKTEVNAYEFHELSKEVQERVCDVKNSRCYMRLIV